MLDFLTKKVNPVSVLVRENQGPSIPFVPVQDGEFTRDLPQNPGVLDSDIMKEYNRVALKLGVSARVSEKPTKLAQTLRDLMIPVYDQAKVEEYMDRQAASKIQQWGWYPLVHRSILDAVLPIRRVSATAWPHSRGAMQRTQYAENIPLPVLLTAERISDACGSDAEFFVAAFTLSPDPFLGVRLKSNPSEFFIVERWDEPSFRG